MSFNVVPKEDRLEVTNEAGRRFTFPIVELQATRRPPRAHNSASGLLLNDALQAVADARRAAEEYAIQNDMI